MDNRISLVKPIIRQKVLIVYHVENRTLCYRHYEDYGEPCNHTIFLPFVQGCVVYKDVEKPEWANTTREKATIKGNEIAMAKKASAEANIIQTVPTKKIPKKNWIKRFWRKLTSFPKNFDDGQC